jgi:hypothetical protein
LLDDSLDPPAGDENEVSFYDVNVRVRRVCPALGEAGQRFDSRPFGRLRLKFT